MPLLPLAHLVSLLAVVAAPEVAIYVPNYDGPLPLIHFCYDNLSDDIGYGPLAILQHREYVTR